MWVQDYLQQSDKNNAQKICFSNGQSSLGSFFLTEEVFCITTKPSSALPSQICHIIISLLFFCIASVLLENENSYKITEK